MKKFYENCQIFTPLKIVNFMLDSIGYKGNVYGKKILENSCGDGNFLGEIVKRYIQYSLKEGYDVDFIKKGLESDIYGYELDIVHFEKCLDNLNKLSNKYGIKNVTWKIFNKDFLKEDSYKFFDFVVGNPPYISYADLDIETRTFIKNKFDSCAEGKPDYYYAFVEHSLNYLKEDGILAYLIPNNIFKNRFGKRIRDILKHSLLEIIDYDDLKMFQGKLTTSSVIICNSAQSKQHISYKNIPNNITYKIQKSNLHDKWIFNNNLINIATNHTFGKEFDVFMSVATLLNDAFVIKQYKEFEDYFYINDDYKIEKEIVRPAASPRGLSNGKNEFIIFPYSYDNNGLIKFREHFCEKYPFAYNYLLQYKKKLESSDKDASALWFEYGRSQALSKLNSEKLLISPIVSKGIKISRLGRECIPYSGIVIIPKGANTIEMAEEILSSNMFNRYVESIGIKSNGKSIRVSVTDIKNYRY